jgi:hypothetical protein
MSQPRPPRGRAAKAAPKSSPIWIFAAILGVVAIVGIGALGAASLRQPAAAAPTPAVGAAPSDSAPLAGGKTDDGFYYVGSADAPVVVTEYADFQ